MYLNKLINILIVFLITWIILQTQSININDGFMNSYGRAPNTVIIAALYLVFGLFYVFNNNKILENAEPVKKDENKKELTEEEKKNEMKVYIIGGTGICLFSIMCLCSCSVTIAVLMMNSNKQR